jgi:hypothetical protein
MAAPVFATNDVPTEDQVNDWFVNVQYVRKTATESVTSSTALQDDDHLTVTVEANAHYVLDSTLFFDGATAGDFKMLWVAPAGAAMPWGVAAPVTTAVGFNDDQTAGFDLTGTGVTFGALGTGTTAAALISGLLVVGGTAGTLKLQWAQGTSSGTATRLFINSYLSLRRVA